MVGGQRRGRGTGLVRRLCRAALFLVLAGCFASLASTTSATTVSNPEPTIASAASAPSASAPKPAKPSAYRAIEPAPRHAKPLPKPVAVPLKRSAVPARRNGQNRTQPAPLSPRNMQLENRQAAAPRPALQSSGPQDTVQADMEPHFAHPQPAPLRAEMQENAGPSEAYTPSRQSANPVPRPYTEPMLAAYPETAPPPYARRVLYQGNHYPQNTQQNNQRREPGPAETEHLPAWIRKHQNESPAERERSLRMEPGFNRLPPAQQQNLINTLHRLNELPPEQRERTLMRMENMERLSPQMREAVRSSARQLNDMPPDRRRMWQKAFRDLENMPPEQRQEILRSPQFAGQFSAQERSIMGNLLAVEPYRNPGPMEAPPVYGR